MKQSRGKCVRRLRSALRRSCASRALLAVIVVPIAVSLLPSTPSASAAMYVGQLFVPQHTCSANTFLQTGAVGSSYTIPTYGAITSWSFYTSTEAVPGLALKVARPDGGGFYTIVGESVAGKQLTNQINTYSSAIVVEPGDVIGLYTSGSSGLQTCGTAENEAPGDPGDTYVYALGNWGPGTTTLFQSAVGTSANPPYAVFPIQAFISGPPITTLAVPECSSGSFTPTVNVDYGTAPKALHFTVDGGPEETAKASSATGIATIKGVPVGVHVLEWWAEDKAGDLEVAHHKANVLVTKEKPHLSIISEQNKAVYNEGERGSVSISASSPHGIAVDPSTRHVPLETTHAGLFLVPATTTDNCGNSFTETFSYTVAPIDRHLRLAHHVFAAAHSGPATARASGTEVTYTATDEGSTNFVVIKGVPGFRHGRGCVRARKGKRRGKPCTHFGENVVGEFSHGNEAGANSFHFSGRVGGRTLKPATYKLEATPETGGINGRTITTTFTIVR